MKSETTNKSYEKVINNFYKLLKSKHPAELIKKERKNDLQSKMEKFGYLPYPYIKALRELSDAEVLFCLEHKWKNEGVFKDGKFTFSQISVLARNNINNSDWIKRECHDIKLINLQGLGDANIKEQSVNFMNWLRQLVILPTGNLQNEIFNTTIYLTPFHPRAFGCAYIPQAACVSPKLSDKNIHKLTGLNADKQVRLFIHLAQLAGHPVIYDILPQTGRFSKTVLANPDCVRWLDVNSLVENISNALDKTLSGSENKVLQKELLAKYSNDDLKKAIDVYKKVLKGSRKFTLTDTIKEIINSIDKDKKLRLYKKTISDSMQNKTNQQLLVQKTKSIITKYSGLSANSINEKDIKNRDEIELALIKNGLWSVPGGAWNSAGTPVFDKMAKDSLYPIMRHYNYKNEDVTKFANLDCQSPFYFVFLENGEYNQKVIDFYINYVKKLVTDFNFDGVRIDHVNHVVDELSENNGIPISYRIPKTVLKSLNDELKSISPYFATLAEYMLNTDFIKEYHEDMNFDIVCGNDITFQNYKNPSVIDADNRFLEKYNRTLENENFVSVLKTYNNQDGEYKHINKYPALLGKQGALFKWFKYKFLPGGYYAQRPIMYADGDESFSKGGIEETICNEVFMKRNDDMEFFTKFDAIDRFAKNNHFICYGEAHIIRQDEDGFTVWQCQTNDTNNILLITANHFAPKEELPNADNSGLELKIGQSVINKTVQLNSDFKFASEYKFNKSDLTEEKLESNSNSMTIEELLPADFRIFRVQK